MFRDVHKKLFENSKNKVNKNTIRLIYHIHYNYGLKTFDMCFISKHCLKNINKASHLCNIEKHIFF